MTKGFRRPFLAAVSCVAAVLVTAACGGTTSNSTATGGASGAAKASKIRILTLPIVDDGPIFYGIDQGIFARHGLDLEIATTAGGAAGIPAMLGGSADMIYGATLSGLQGATKKLPVRIVAAAATSLPASQSEADYVAVVTTPNTGVASQKDLAGKTMAVNTLGNINELFTKAFLKKSAGVDPATVKLVELPFPEQPSALLAGRIGGTMIGAPFLSSLQSNNAKVLGYPYRVQQKPVVVGSYMTTESFAKTHDKDLKAFVAALEEIVTEMAKPESRPKVIDSLAKKTKIDPKVLETVVLPNYQPKVDVQSLQETVALAREFGLLTTDPELDKILLPSAR